MSLANARIVRQRVRCRCCFLHRFLEMTYSAHRTGKVVSYQKGIGMRKYLEFFRVEAKSLLKNFQKNEQSAVARCAEVFGDKKDLSLMNMQHVVAKEYGFDNWNALYKAENWQLAEALIKSKNQVLSMPLYGDELKGNVYSRAERYEIGLIKSREGVDLENFVQTSPNGSASPFLQLERFDLSDYDLSKMNPLFVSFDEYTRWSEDVDKLPQNFNPQKFIKQRKNPGLGIRRLHRQNLVGQERAMAVIDGFLLSDHFWDMVLMVVRWCLPLWGKLVAWLRLPMFIIFRRNRWKIIIERSDIMRKRCRKFAIFMRNFCKMGKTVLIRFVFCGELQALFFSRMTVYLR